ncbi:MAG: acetyl-CoA carboxylase biotin carboxyl carrier protein subunit [Anaerolineae bacterium]|nr:acetyl-CoA carboxylase biotin carboxyl carrier protein subunit [Anaerolineae bacterium]
MESTTNHRSLKITVNDKEYLVEVEDPSTSPLTVKVNGQPYRVTIDPAAKESAPVEKTALPQTIMPQTPASEKIVATPVTVNSKAVKAPMPGHIVHISVQPGDEVNVGQELCSLEAMKMKNAIRAHRAGIVAEVAVSLGQAVAYGDVLVTFA